MTVLGWSPGVQRGVPLHAPLTVYFDRAVNAPSVESAWRLTPSVAGRFSASGNAVTFTPVRPLPPGATYHLEVTAGARSSTGIALARPFSTSFSTGDALRVVTVSPARGTSGVPVSGLLALTFNHPMVALGGLSVPPANPAGWHISITPRPAGYGHWLGTSTWLFHASHGLAPSTRYSVNLAPTVRDASGETLGRAIRWSFRTVTPEIFSRSPSSGSRFADPRSAVTVTFNQPMDHPATARAFTLDRGGKPVAGTVSWKANKLLFHPAARLAAGGKYLVKVGGAALSSNRRGALGERVSWRFRAAPAPRVVDSTPSPDGVASANGGFGRPGCPVCGYGVQLHFSTPMDKRSLDHHLVVTPDVSHLQTFFGGPDQSGEWTYYVSGDFAPSSRYTIGLTSGVVDAFARPLTAGYTLPFTTARITPAITLYGTPGSQGAISFSAGRVAQAPIQAINVAKVSYTLVRTTPKALAARCCGDTGPPAGKTVNSWKVAIPHPLNKLQDLGVSLANAGGSPLAPGLYWLGASGGGVDVSETVVVTTVGMTVKSGGNGDLVWLASAKTGLPLPATKVQLLDYQGHTIGSGTTGTQGVVFFHHPPRNLASFIVDAGGQYGLTMTYWTAGVAPQDDRFVLASFAPQQYTPPANGAYLYTDRPIYRPGQRVYFRGILWRDRDGVYSSFGRKIANIAVTDSSGRALLRVKLPLDRFGAIHGSVLLPASTPTGTDSIYANVANLVWTNDTFTVAEYRKPEFLTSVSATRSGYAVGETVKATAGVHYVFGPPAVRQPVNWVVYAQPVIPQPPGWDAYTFVDDETLWSQFSGGNTNQPQSQFGAVIASGKGKTDAHGNLALAFLAKISHSLLDSSVTIEATATDAGHQSVSGRTSIAVHHADLAIGLAAEAQIVPAGQQAAVDVVTVRQDGTPLPNTSIAVDIAKRTYTNKLVDRGGQQSQWEAVPHDTPITHETLTTDAQGKARITFTPADGGEYRVVVSATDNLHNATSTAISIDASAAGFSDWGTGSDTSLALKADKTVYNAGDTAHILVAAPFDNATALVTLERGTIRKYWIRQLSSNSSTIDVPITLDDLPNVFVTVTLYHGQRGTVAPDWRYGAIDLHVRVDPRHLSVKLAQSGARHHPGDPVTYTVTTTDAHGHPVSAEVSLALVDTAVLALQDENNPDILQALYGDRSLGVSTASEGTISIDQLVEKPDFLLRPGYFGTHAAAAPRAVVKTGGGGGDNFAGLGGSNPAVISVRSHFADTALWSGAIVTNASGHAAVRLRLPDNATTWRLDARAAGMNHSVGQAIITTLATRDLVVRPVVPRFFNENDTMRIGAVVNNSLHRQVSVAVSLRASGLVIHSHAVPVVTIPAGGERLVLWPVTAGITTHARVLLTARPITAGVHGDAVALTLPVHPPLTDETVATSGQVLGTIRQLVVVPPGAVARPGALTVQISASLVAGAGAAFAQLRPVAHESNESVADRVLAAASLRTLPESIAGLRGSTYRRLPLVVAAGVQKLLDNQYGDGGWPWFNDPWASSDPEISADAVQALAASGEHGPLVRQALVRGRNFLSYALDYAPVSERPHIMLVLARSGGVPHGRAESLYANSVQRLHLDSAPLADLGMTLALGRDGKRAASILSVLDARAIVSATGAHWESSIDDPWSGGAIASTTSVLSTLVALRPHDPFVPAAARWLMLSRSGDSWDCQYDSAQAIAALVTYARAVHEGRAAYTYHVMVDGRASLHGRYGGTSQRGTASTRVAIGALRRTGANVVSVDRDTSTGTFGSGPLYYLARLHYYLPAASIAARSEGVSISRIYLDMKGRPIQRISTGSPYQVRLTVSTDQTLLYLDLEDPLPAGSEAIDQSLNTSQQGLFKPPSWWQPFTGTQDLTWFLSHSDLHDDRVSLYASYLPPGVYHYTYLADAIVPGSYGVAPAHVSETFFPEVFGRSAGLTFTVTG